MQTLPERDLSVRVSSSCVGRILLFYHILELSYQIHTAGGDRAHQCFIVHTMHEFTEGNEI